MRKSIYFLSLAVILLSAVVMVAYADGTETLGPPTITVASGSGVVIGGTGLEDQPGTFDLHVPGTVKQALIYWTGAVTSNTASDSRIRVNGTAVNGTLIGGPSFFFVRSGKQHYFSSYRADITNMVNSGMNSFVIRGMNNLDADGIGENDGAGILVIYDDGSTNSEIKLKDGLDLAYINFSEPRKTTVPQTFTFVPAATDRIAHLKVFAASVGENRPNSITVEIGGNTEKIVDPLGSFDGLRWDSADIQISIPAGADSATVQVWSESDGSGNNPASLAWTGAALSVPIPPPSEEEPTPTNTPTNTSVPTSTNTPTNTPVPTSTNTPTNTPVATATNTPTNTPVPTSTNTPTNTPVATATNTPTNTPVPTATNTPTNTPVPTATNTPVATATYTPTPQTGYEGCTPGYWKQPHHLDDWPPTGLNPTDNFDTTFGVSYFNPDITLLQALQARGGGVNKVARHGTAALLNALHPSVDYPLTPAEVILAVQNRNVDELVNYNEFETPGFCD